jgi:prepilin-type N-terminal cleavage/methylation domain-containing protein
LEELMPGACICALVGQVGNLRPIGNRPNAANFQHSSFAKRVADGRGAPIANRRQVGNLPHNAGDPESSRRAKKQMNSNTERGVTLVEMLVVCSIIGLIAAISFPSFSAGLDSVRMSSATGMVSSFLNSAVNRAERRQQAVELIVSPKDNLLIMYTNEPGFERKVKMPDGISIQAVLPAIDGEPPDSPRQLMLMPGATAPGIGILLGNQHGSHRIVRLDPMTGFPRVESPDAASNDVAKDAAR